MVVGLTNQQKEEIKNGWRELIGSDPWYEYHCGRGPKPEKSREELKKEKEEAAIKIEEVKIEEITKEKEDIAMKIQEGVKEAVSNILPEIDFKAIQVVPNMDIPSQLIQPIVYTKLLNEDGSVAEDSSTTENTAVDLSNPYIAIKNQQGVNNTSLQQNQPILVNSIIPDYKNNVDIITKYPALRPIERSIRALEGIDVLFLENDIQLIEAMIFVNGIFMPNNSFTIDINGKILGLSNKWFNIFRPVNNPYENYPAIHLGRLDLISKYVTNQADIEELKAATMYSHQYIVVSDMVDLMSLPPTVNEMMKQKIIDRLYEAITVGVFEDFRFIQMEKFKFYNYASLYSFDLISGNVKIHASKTEIKRTIYNQDIS